MESLVIPATITWQLIVVDNNSDDDTRNAIEAFKRKSGLPIEYLLEKIKGNPMPSTPALKRPKGTLWHSPMMTALWTIARGSLAETQYFVHLAKRLGYLAEDNYDVLATDVKSTFARLHGLIRAVQKDSLPIGNGRRRLTDRSQ